MIESAINWRNIDTLLVDMDGTVLDLAFDNYFWAELLPQMLAQQRGISVPSAREQMREYTSSVLGSLQWYCIEHWTRQLELDVAAIKHAMRHRISYLPGALEFLQHTRAAPLRILIVTNAHPQTLAIKLRQTHLDRHVDGIFSSHEFGHPKESAGFWQRFEKEQRLQRDRTVLVDDSAPVVTAARDHGLAGAVTITRPDSGMPERAPGDGPAVGALADLRAVLTDR